MLQAKDIKITSEEHATFLSFVERRMAMMKLMKELNNEVKSYWELMATKYSLDLTSVDYVPAEHEYKLLPVAIRISESDIKSREKGVK